MANEQVDIEFKITGIEPAVSSLDNLEAAVKDVGKASDKTEESLDKTAEAAKNLGNEAKNTGEEGEASMKLIDEATGGLGTRLKDSAVAIKTLGKSFVTSFKAGIKGASGMGKALIATGIGAIIVGVGLLVAYWDDIVGFANGVSAESKQILEDTEATVAAQQEALAALESQENSLKLQGKSEKEIRDLKIAQTEEVIRAMEAQLLLQQEQAKAQEEAAIRNRNIAQGVIAFLTSPITLLLGAIDALTYGLEKIGVLNEATSLAEDFTGSIAGAIGFDPEETKKEGEETIKETEKQLMALKSKRDGFILANKNEATKNREEKLAADKQAEDDLAAYKIQKAQELADLKKEIANAEANTEAEIRTKALEDLDLYYEQLIEKAIEQGIATDELEKSQLEKSNALKAQYAKEDSDRVKQAKQEIKDKADFEKQLARDTENAKLDVASAGFDAISSIAGEQSAVGKAAAVASSTINTYQAATNALANTPAPPPFPQIAAGIAVVSGLMNVRKILSTPTPGNSGGGGGGGGSVPSMPSVPSFDPTTALAGAGASQQQDNVLTLDGDQNASSAPVIRAYVVSDNMTTQQEKDKKINDLARL